MPAFQSKLRFNRSSIKTTPEIMNAFCPRHHASHVAHSIISFRRHKKKGIEILALSTSRGPGCTFTNFFYRVHTSSILTTRRKGLAQFTVASMLRQSECPNSTMLEHRHTPKKSRYHVPSSCPPGLDSQNRLNVFNSQFAASTIVQHVSPDLKRRFASFDQSF